MHVKKSDFKRQAILDTAYRLFRAQGFDKTSVADITAAVGGSRATIYSHFPSKEELFVACMMAAAENYMVGTLKHLDASRADPGVALRNFGTSFLSFICSPEQLEVRRLMVAEAARSGTGKLFFDKISTLRAHVSAYLSACMASGTLRADDSTLAADHLGALLEAEILEPLLLHVRDVSPEAKEIALAVRRAVAAFLRAYAPTGQQRTPLRRRPKQWRTGKRLAGSVASLEGKSHRRRSGVRRDLKFRSGCVPGRFELNCTRQFKSVFYEDQD